MAPLITLIAVTVLARLTGAFTLGRGYFATLPATLGAGVTAMFLLTGSAHFVERSCFSRKERARLWPARSRRRLLPFYDS